MEPFASELNHWYLNHILHAINRADLIEEITTHLQTQDWKALLDVLAKEDIGVLGPKLGRTKWINSAPTLKSYSPARRIYRS